ERGIETNNNEEMIVKAIKLIKKTIDEDPELSEMIPASLTKNQKIYNKIKKAKLT
ncbi:TPA: hypothetical protein PTC31_002267, partial [Staphylococcus pseudintermedius]|nr:hypothetical protein [Staphylococcus pseudintermedius]HDK5722533.1 hypothetical protein [Staphylococcus pseudintermedius]